MAVTSRTHSDPLNRNDDKMRYRPLGRTGLEGLPGSCDQAMPGWGERAHAMNT